MDKLGAKSSARDYKPGVPGLAREDEQSNFTVHHGLEEVEASLHRRPTSGPVNEFVERDYADVSEEYYSAADVDAL